MAMVSDPDTRLDVDEDGIKRCGSKDDLELRQKVTSGSCAGMVPAQV